MKHLRATLLSILIVPLAATGVRADVDPSLNGWLNEKLQNILATKLDLRGESRQSETPSQSDNSTSLVDRGSSSLLGLALNRAGLPATSDNDNGSATSITLNAYSFYAAFKGADPLNPTFYKEHAPWRRASFTVGYDNDMSTDGSAQKTQLLGAKLLIIDGRQPDTNSAHFKNLMSAAIIAFGSLTGKIEDEILDRLLSDPSFQQRMKDRYRSFLVEQHADATTVENTVNDFKIGPNRLPTGNDPRAAEFFADFTNDLFVDFRGLLATLGPEVERDLERIIEQDAAANLFAELERTTQSELERIGKGPQLSFSALTKQRPDGPDGYTGEMIFDWGLGSRMGLVLNGSYDYKDNKGADERDVHSERLALQLDFQIGRQQIVGRSPFRFSLAAEAKRMTEVADTWKAQAKLTIPVLDGVELPVSVTFASNTDLIEEEDVRGNFGFTLDVARLVDAFKQH